MGKKAMRGSIYDVARVSGVSIGTVSRVFNKKPHVSPQTRAHVLEIARRIKYRPNTRSRGINIGLIIHNLEEANEVGFTSETLATLARHASVRGAVLEIFPIHAIECVFRNYIHGLIAIVFGPNAHLLREVPNMPIVSINNLMSGPNLHCVASDHVQGAYLATRHLIQQGHCKIGFFEIDSDGWGSQERQRGYRRALEEAGLMFRSNLVRFTAHHSVENALVALLHAKPSGILICGEDLSLLANQILLHKLGLKIPDDLSVITYEVPLVSSLLSPPQTTVAQPWRELGQCAVDTVLSLIDRQPAKPLKILLPNKLIVRKSVRCMPE